MAYFKEIVTKAIIGKGKKTTTENQSVNALGNVDNVLGCWVINHNFNGYVTNDTVIVSGDYDVNIWYSYDNNTKTNVVIKKFNYQNQMNIRIKENSKLTNNSEIIVKCLKDPSVIDANVENGNINITIEKQMGVEVIGDTKVRVSVTDDYDDYEEIVDDEISIKENYLDKE